MTPPRKKIVLDANILVRGVLGERIPHLLERYHNHILFYTPSPCFSEARAHLPAILNQRSRVDADMVLHALDALHAIVQSVDEAAYVTYEAEAKQRIGEQDLNDWAPVALAMALDCPIWTEDKDFFGIGMATWRTRNVEIDFSG